MRAAIASSAARSNSKPSRPAIAARCTAALVEPPIAASSVAALWKAAGVSTSSKRIGAPANSTARRPVASAIRSRAAVVAGAVALPGSATPSASLSEAIVDAVPITEQVPTEPTSSLFAAQISSSVGSPAR